MIEWPIRKCERSSMAPEANLQTGIARVINTLLNRASRMIGWPITKCKRS